MSRYAPEGFCAECLLRDGFSDRAEETVGATSEAFPDAPAVPSLAEERARFFGDYGGGVCGGTLQRLCTRATIRNNVITNNTAKRGGGLAFCGGRMDNNLATQVRGAGSGSVDTAPGQVWVLRCANRER